MIYRIVCDGVDLYGPEAGLPVLNPHLEIELNAAGSLEFTLPVQNENWAIPEIFKSEIEVWENDEIIWFGRPLQITRDWNNQRKVVCEGALAYFNDSVQRTWEMQPSQTHTNVWFFHNDKNKGIIDTHNDQVADNRKFIVGTVDIDAVPSYRKTDYNTTYDCIQNMCLATDGGYMILRKEYEGDVARRYIDWVQDMPVMSSQDVQFGLNLLDIVQDLNGADVCTVLIPTGADDLTLADLGNKNPDDNDGVGHDSGSDEIYFQPGIEKYGRVVRQESWTDYSSTNGLWLKSKQWLIDKNTDIPTIECSAADLYYIKDPDKKAEVPLKVGTKVHVVSGPHGINENLIMYKISMDLDSGIKKVTIGTPPKRELTDIIAPGSGGGSTRGNSGTGGGTSETGSGNGGSSGSTYVPVQDVKVKLIGEDKYSSVVKKKVAKIDLSNIASPVKDVKVDGTSVVDDQGNANITLPEVPVQDVAVDGTSIVNAQGVAELDSSEFGTTVVANPSGSSTGDLTTIQIGEDIYDVSSGGGTTVIANPSDPATDTLETVQIGVDIYAMPVTDVLVNNVSVMDGTVAKISGSSFSDLYENKVTWDVEEPGVSDGAVSDLWIELNKSPNPIIALTERDVGGQYDISSGDYTYDSLVQDINPFNPIQYWDESAQEYRYDPTDPIHVHNAITAFDGRVRSSSFWYPNVLSDPEQDDKLKPYSEHLSSVRSKGSYGWTATYGSYYFEYHIEGKKFKPVRVTGVLKCNSTVESVPDDCKIFQRYHDGSFLSIMVSHDGETWRPVSWIETTGKRGIADEFLDYKMDWGSTVAEEDYYEYIRFGPGTNGANLGFFTFNFYVEPDDVRIEDVWYKVNAYNWLNLNFLRKDDLEPNPEDAATEDLTTLRIGDTVYEIVGKNDVTDVEVDGSSVVNAQGVAEITLPEVPVQDVEVDGQSVLNAQGIAEITLPVIPDVPVLDVEVDGVSVLDEQTGIAEITIPVKDVEVDGDSVVNQNGVAEITMPTIPVTDVEVDGVSVLNQGVAEITLPEVPVQDVYLDGSSVLDNNGIAQLTSPTIPVEDVYLDGSSVVDQNGIAQLTSPIIPVTDVEVDGTSVVNAQGVAEITMPVIPTIPVTDVEVDGSSVVNAQGVAEITLPTVSVEDVYLDGSSVVDANGIAQLTSPTIPVTDIEVDGTSVVNAQGVAEITMPVIPTIPVEDVYLDGSSVVDQNGIAQLTSPTIPVEDVEVDGVSVVNAQGVAEITMPTIPVEDVEVDGVSVVNAQGIAEITMPVIPTIPVTDVEVDGVSVVNAQGIAEITLPSGGGVEDVYLDGSSVVDANGIAQLSSPTIPVEDVEVDGVSVVNAQGVAEITLPTIPVTDVEVDGMSVVNAQGIAELDSSDFGTYVEANPQSGSSVGDLTSITIGSDKYDIPSGGTNVVANPAGSATTDLTKLQVGNDIYGIPEGTEVEANPSGSATQALNTLKVGTTIYNVPSAIPNPHIYSTTEQIVGTWHDGSTIYERTWKLNSAINVGNNWSDVRSIVISNIDLIIKAEGVGSNTGYCYPLIAAMDAGFLQVISGITFDNAIDTFTLQYTKTS